MATAWWIRLSPGLGHRRPRHRVQPPRRRAGRPPGRGPVTAPLLSVRGLCRRRAGARRHPPADRRRVARAGARRDPRPGRAKAARARPCCPGPWCGCFHPDACEITAGSVVLDGRRSDGGRLNRSCAPCAAGDIGMVFQNPTSHLDPVMRVGDPGRPGPPGGTTGCGRARRGPRRSTCWPQVGFADPARALRRLPARVLRWACGSAR